MSDQYKRILVTSALPYSNGPIHVGHLAGAYLPADIYCRYQRLQARDVVYICGSDQHGVPIMLRARAEGVDPQVIADRYHQQIQEGFEGIGISFDYYGQTSSDTHRQVSQDFFEVLDQKGAFVQRSSEQLFDPEAKLFLADRFIKGECPKCHYPEAYGDQCENCGQALSPSDLISPRSTVTDATPITKETTHWYLPLGDSQPWLEEWMATKGHWKTNVLGQVRSWLQDGLGDRSMTRDLPWGVPVPESVGARAGTDVDGKVTYVWFDAPLGYISATREWAESRGEPDAWEPYWKDEETKLLHFIGKDNIVFHCIIFPTMLKLHGDYVLPENVPANEFLNLKGLKFSTSRGVAVWLHEFLEKYDADYLRYGTAKMIPERSDCDFSWEGLQALVNNELADAFGNFINRTMTFAHKHFGGEVPSLVNPNEMDQETLAAMTGFPSRIGALIEGYRFRDATDEMMALARLGNKYFNDAAPWSTRKTDMEACGNTIHISLQIAAALSVLFEPVVPTSCERLRGMLGLTGVRSSAPNGPEASIGWQDAAQPLLQAGQELGPSVILFNKLTDKQVQEEIDTLKARAEAGVGEESGYEEPGETIQFDDFMKLDLRVGKVLVAEPLPKSKKLIRTEVDLGYEKRQILAGIAQHIEPEALVGQSVIVVANLAPRKMFGLESQGMLLMAEDREGQLSPVLASSEPGSTVR